MNKMKNTWKNTTIRLWMAVALVLSVIAGNMEHTVAVEGKTLSTAVFAYLDVGQGNAELIRTKRQAVLIDTGKKSAYADLKKQLKKLGVKKIQTMVVTHPDADHMESADEVIKDYKVKKIFMPKVQSTTLCYKRMMQAIADHNVKVAHPKAGTTIKLTSSCKAKVLSADAGSDTNEASIVMRAVYGKRSFLYMGDATARVESQILAAGYKTASDIYLMSHHGSDTANGVLFVKKALASKYKTAVISVGAGNSYGHPVPNVVRRAQKYADHLYRTDEKGCIVAKTDGNSLRFSFQTIRHTTYQAGSTRNAVKSKKNTKKTKVKGKSKVVYTTNTGKKYHRAGCRYLKKGKIRIKLSEAKAQGLTPCSICCPS